MIKSNVSISPIIEKQIVKIMLVVTMCLSITFLAYGYGLKQEKELTHLEINIEKARLLNLNAENGFRSGDDKADLYLDSLKLLIDQTESSMIKGYYYRAIGRKNDFSGDRATALENYDQAIEMFNAAGGDQTDLAFSYVLKAFVLNNTMQYQACLEVIEEGLPLARKARSKNSLCFMLDFMGDYHFYEDYDNLDYTKALSYYKQVEEVLDQISNTLIISDNYACQAVCYARLGKLDQADIYFVKGEEIAKANNQMEVLFGLYNKWGQWLKDSGKIKEAGDFYSKAYDEIITSPLLEFRSRGEKLMSDYYQEIGDYKKAFHHFKNHRMMEDSLDDNSAQAKYQELQETLKAQNQKIEIEQLKNEQLSLTKKYLLLLLGLIILLGFALYYLIFQRHKIKRIEQEKQKQLEIARIKGQAQERTRIASELHDNVNTKIAAIRYRLEAMGSITGTEHNNALDETKRMLDDAYQDVRFISKNIIPEDLQEQGLDVAIRDFVNKLSINDRIKFNLNTRGDQWQMLGDRAYEVYLIIFELFNNVLKHSNATRVNIDLAAQNRVLNIIFSDNGEGFCIDHESSGSGLKNILSRIQLLNGHADMKSNKGEGVHFSANIPIT